MATTKAKEAQSVGQEKFSFILEQRDDTTGAGALHWLVSPSWSLVICSKNFGRPGAKINQLENNNERFS